MNSCLLEYATVFAITNKLWPVILAFYFDFVLPFYFLKWNGFFLTFIPVLSESRYYFRNLLSREVCTNLQIKLFSLVKLWYTIWMYGSSEFQSNNIKKDPSQIYYLWKYLSRKFTFNQANNHNFFLIIAKRFTKNSQNSLSLFLNITSCYRKIETLPWS